VIDPVDAIEAPSLGPGHPDLHRAQATAETVGDRAKRRAPAHRSDQRATPRLEDLFLFIGPFTTAGFWPESVLPSADT
jgi:hypothetical protein